MATVGQAIVRRGVEGFTGRVQELAVLAEALRRDGPLVVYVHGLGGIGKTSLLNAYAEWAGQQGARIIGVDCRVVEPTERGLLTELAGALGADASLEGVVEQLASAGPSVLLFDTYERFRLLDSWTRRVLVPRLPATARLVIASRERPAAAWDASPAPGAAVRSLALGPLPEDAALELLCRDGAASPAQARRLNRAVGGHPLALRVVHATLSDRDARDIEAAAVPRAVEALTRLYLDDLDPTTRIVIDAASTIRRSTRSLLRAVLGAAPVEDAFERLRDLPFVELALDGLHLHDSVRHTAAEALRATDPVRYRSYRRAAWRQLRRELASAAPQDLWRYTADLLYLIEQPLVQEAFFPSSGVHVTVEPARAEDGPAVCDIIQRHDRPGRAAALLHWWERMPESFSVARDDAGEVTGFDTAFEYRDARPDWLQQDPLTSRWLTHLREHRLPKDQLILFNPRWLDRHAGERPCDSQAAFFMEAKRVYMELRPHVRRLYLAVTEVSPYGVILPRLGFAPLPDPQVVVQDVTYHSFVLDLGPGSVDSWLSWLIGTELGTDDDEPILDPETLEVRLRGQRIRLSRLEFGVMHALLVNAERAVSRVTLIEQVWGTTYVGGSNVVDAVIRTLRRKLGDNASAIESVRGVGYRYTSRA